LDWFEELKTADPEVMSSIDDELQRERSCINLIASENYASLAVLAAQGSLLTNKYAEGYPKQRFYSGCEPVDAIETVAVSRAMKLFDCEHANVQPHAGSSANLAAYMTVLEPRDTIMAMDLRCGGHLTHGSPANFSGMFYDAFHYGVDRQTETLDYDAIREQARKVRPKLIVAGASAYPRKIDFAKFREIADDVGAKLMVDMAHFGGLVVGGVHPDPVPYSDLVTGTTHKTLRGPRGGFVLSKLEHCSKLDAIVFPGTQGGPLMHVIAAKAVCFGEARQPEFKKYTRSIVDNAEVLCDFMAAQGFRIVSGGTETHLFLVDLRPFGLSGREAQDILLAVGINVNMNEIPYDPQPPTVTSGIRIGTPAVTTRGMGKAEMETLGSLITRALKARSKKSELQAVIAGVRELTEAFPLYPELS
jgi:glycine hydroxymethyltransferase